MDTQPAVPSADGVVSKPSPYPVDETVRRLEEAARGKGLTVFARIDHRSGAREAGLDMQDEQVLIFGNPQAGTPGTAVSPQPAQPAEQQNPAQKKPGFWGRLFGKGGDEEKKNTPPPSPQQPPPQ